MAIDNFEKLNNNEGPKRHFSFGKMEPEELRKRALEENIDFRENMKYALSPTIRKDEDERGSIPEGLNDELREIQKEKMEETTAEIIMLLEKIKSEENSLKEVIFLETSSATQFTIFKENGTNAMITLGIESILLIMPGAEDQKFFYKDKETLKNKIEDFCK